jgi:hypothetical protein
MRRSGQARLRATHEIDDEQNDQDQDDDPRDHDRGTEHSVFSFLPGERQTPVSLTRRNCRTSYPLDTSAGLEVRGSGKELEPPWVRSLDSAGGTRPISPCSRRLLNQDMANSTWSECADPGPPIHSQLLGAAPAESKLL